MRAESWSELRGSLWVKPAAAVVLALASGSVLTLIDVPDDSLLGLVLFRGDAADARQLLTAVTQTMITVTSMVFVLTVVALQIASSQFSPRLLRSFLRDRGTQLVLSTFVGTVAYSLAGLHTVGSPSAGGQALVPRLAVTGALLLALVSVGMLVYYIQHITDSIRIDTIMRQVEHTTVRLIARTCPPLDGRPAPPVPDVPTGAHVVAAPRSGYVQGHHVDGLHALVSRVGVTVRITAAVGDHLVAGRPLAFVWGPRQVDTALEEAVTGAVVIAGERKTEHDVGFGLRQLVDIASRALSPSLNDPYSAVQAVHHLTVVLSEMAQRSTATVVRVDASGTARVVVPVVDFPAHLSTAVNHIRWSMTRRPRVALALLDLIEDVAAATSDPGRLAALAQQLDLVADDAARVVPNDTDREVVLERAARVRRALGGPGVAPLDGHRGHGRH